MDRKTEMEAVSLGLTGVANARRIAGYPAAGGRKVKGERLLRTGALGGASAEDLQRLIRYQVKYVVDFRTSFEKAGAPDPEIPGAVHLDIPILEESGDSAAGGSRCGRDGRPGEGDPPVRPFREVGKPLSGYGDECFFQQGFKRFFDLLLDCREGAVLWHCTGGKDRTGAGGISAALYPRGAGSGLYGRFPPLQPFFAGQHRGDGPDGGQRGLHRGGTGCRPEPGWCQRGLSPKGPRRHPGAVRVAGPLSGRADRAWMERRSGRCGTGIWRKIGMKKPDA